MDNETNTARNFIDAAKSVFKPRTDYRALSKPLLIMEAAMEWTTALEIVLRLIDRPEFEPDLALGLARTVAARANEPKLLALLYARSDRWEPLASLLFRLFAAEHILVELSHRLSSPLRVGSVLAAVGAPDGAQYYQAFLKTLKIERLQDYEDPNDSPDLRHDAVVGALQKAKKIREGLLEVFPKPAAFVMTPELNYLPDCRRWNWPELYHNEMARIGAELGVYFADDIEFLPGAAWQAYHDVLRERDTLMRGGPGRKQKGTKTNPACSSGGLRPNGRESCGDRSVRHHEYVDNEHAAQSTSPEEAAIAREQKDKMLQVVASFSPRARRYIREKLREATQKDAAKAAGIGDRMARKYEAKLRKLLGKAKTVRKV